MKNHVWFVATTPGSYDIFCSQYCGTNHSAMTAKVEAIAPEKFDTWLNEGKGVALLPGLALLEKYNCLGCHSLDGSKKVGPSLKGVFGSMVRVTRGGKPAVELANEAYLRESILAPSAAIVEGFPPIMPVIKELTDAEVTALVAYLKVLK
jgi:cytochrome c oxidase subunit 2